MGSAIGRQRESDEWITLCDERDPARAEWTARGKVAGTTPLPMAGLRPRYLKQGVKYLNARVDIKNRLVSALEKRMSQSRFESGGDPTIAIWAPQPLG